MLERKIHSDRAVRQAAGFRRRRSGPRSAAGMAARRSLFRHGFADLRRRLAARGRGARKPSRKPIAASSRPSPRTRAARRKLGDGGRALRGDWKICSGESCPMPASSMPSDTTDPARAKFYGDAQEKVTDASVRSSVLRARIEPARRCAARRGDGRRGRSRIIGRGSRTSARSKPYQLDDELEQLFHREIGHRRRRLEPAVRRDDRRAALQGRWRAS